MGFEADPFDHQHAVTQQTLDPLLLQLLEEVGAVAGQGVHAGSAGGPQSINTTDDGPTAWKHKKKQPLK